MTPDLLWYVAEEKKKKKTKKKLQDGDEERVSVARKGKKEKERRRTSFLLLLLSFSGTLSTHNHVSQSTAGKKRPDDLSLSLRVCSQNKIKKSYPLFSFCFLLLLLCFFLTFPPPPRSRLIQWTVRFHTANDTVWNVGMRNCHPSKRKQKKTSQEMGSFFFSRRKWFARLGTNSALACEWHTKNSCMTFLEFLTILSCSTHLSCSFAQLDYDFFVFRQQQQLIVTSHSGNLCFCFQSLPPPLKSELYMSCRTLIAWLNSYFSPCSWLFTSWKQCAIVLFFLFPIFFGKYYF